MSEADRYFIKKGFSKVIKQGIEEFTDDDGNYIHFDLVIERFTCNCYLSAKELQAINKKVEELRMDMSNKTSDKNVANIEEDVELVKRYLENSAYKESNSDFFKNGGWEIVDLKIPKAIEQLLQDYTRQKQINEEHKKENGLLREKVKELEEENVMLRKSNNIAKDVKIEDITQLINKSYKEFMNEFIPTQKVKTKIKELKRQRRELGFKTYLRKEDMINDDREIVCQIQGLQELLQESEDK